jgi:hypothetical protein
MRYLVIVALGALAASACADRAHLYKTAGAATTAAFAAQAGVRGAPMMLSPLDAEILLQNYRNAATRGAGPVDTARAADPTTAPSAAPREDH